MIKIKPYTELSNGDEIKQLYMSMVAKALPFYPEDIFPDGYFYPDGKTKKPLSEFKRHAMTRKPSYIQKLNYYQISDGDNTKGRKKADALLAKKIISEYSNSLFDFLYKGSTGEGHVVPEKLHTLLTTAVDDESLEANGLQKVLKESPRINEERRKDLQNYVFRYDVFSKQDQIHRFVRLLGVDICPYCNRIYITTAERGEKSSPIRPELDHYRCKSKYPFLAVSILNLIPSCSFCNHAKHEKEDPILYPYKDEIGSDLYFQTKPRNGITYLTGAKASTEDFDLTLCCRDYTDKDLHDRANRSIDQLRLSALYSSHKGYVSDLIAQRYIFTDEMIKEICNLSDSLILTPDEVRRMLLLKDISQENWGNRPLTKLAHDISEELDVLYGKCSTNDTL